MSCWVWIGIGKPFYDRINRRVELMIEEGLIEETKMLVERGYDWNLTALKAIGYKELKPYLEGTSSLAEAITILNGTPGIMPNVR